MKRSLSWDSIQKKSNDILADGLYELIGSPSKKHGDIEDENCGNYLISFKKLPYYIGEANNVTSRIKQQFNSSTSTFYKNYQKYLIKLAQTQALQIDKFNVQHTSTNIGRKEVEEFGIVNLPTLLNGFQLGKRERQKICCHNGLWNTVQNEKQEFMHQADGVISKLEFSKWFEHTVPSKAGIYIVKDKSSRIIYIGESSNLSERYNTHSNRTYFSALRRHIATEILDFELKEVNGKKKYLNDKEEKAVNLYLKTCNVCFHGVSFGRYELEEFLIQKHKPLLNRKSNKNR